MSDIQVRNDNGEVEEYNKEDMTDEQRSLFDDVLALQKRCVEIEPMAREFADKKHILSGRPDFFYQRNCPIRTAAND